MKISLIHNAKAGSGVSAEELRREIVDAGHQVIATIEPSADIEHVLDPHTELVVVAGGDGTVQSVAIALAGRNIPLAILPMGTANNIASSLGLDGTTEALVASWARARPVPLDLGVAQGAWGKRRFIESIGAGLVANGIIVMDSEAPHGKDPDLKIEKALRRFQDMLAKLVARPCQLSLDGQRIESELLLVEVLNIRAVGPGLRLAPDADPSDGLFDVVTAGESHREQLQAYLDERLAGREPELTLPSRRARTVEVAGWELLHLDDWVHPHEVNGVVTTHVEPRAVEVLMP